MKKTRGIIQILIVCTLFLTLLAGCGSKEISSFKDVPVHPQAEEVSLDYLLNHTAPMLPWSIMDGKVIIGPFDGYTVDGQNYYQFTVADPNPSLVDFYTSKFPDWEFSSSDITDNLTGLSFTLYYWKNDEMALVVLQTPDMFNPIFLKK